jgi:hypothetical protein
MQSPTPAAELECRMLRDGGTAALATHGQGRSCAHGRASRLRSQRSRSTKRSHSYGTKLRRRRGKATPKVLLLTPC